MNKFKKLLALLLAFVFSLSVVVVSHAQAGNNHVSEQHDFFTEMMGEEFAENYFQTLNFLDNFYGSLPQNRMGDTIYPDNFGGVYIDDYGNMVILVVGSMDERANTAFITAHVEDGVLVREVVFSYNDLRGVFNYLNDFIPNNRENLGAANVTGIGLCVIGNNIIIALDEYSYEQIAIFRRVVLDSSILVFEQRSRLHSDIVNMPQSLDDMLCVSEIDSDSYSAIAPLNAIQVRPGDCLFARRANGNIQRVGTVGYRAIANIGGIDRFGFVVAAHLGDGLRNGDTVFNSSHQPIGLVMGARLDTIDTAFVSTLNMATVVNTSHFGALNMRRSDPSVGAVVFHDRTQGARTGRRGQIVRHWSGYVGWPGFWVNGWEHSIPSRDGDSGGMVYSFVSQSNSGIQGTHIAGWGWDQNGIFISAFTQTLLLPGDNPRPH